MPAKKECKNADQLEKEEQIVEKTLQPRICAAEGIDLFLGRVRRRPQILLNNLG